jgi:hypothetical protein
MEGESEIAEKINDTRHLDNHPGTMNFKARLEEAQRIHYQNMMMAERLSGIQPYIRTDDVSTAGYTVRTRSPRGAMLGEGGPDGEAEGQMSPSLSPRSRKTKYLKELEYTLRVARGEKGGPSDETGYGKGVGRTGRYSPVQDDDNAGQLGWNPYYFEMRGAAGREGHPEIDYQIDLSEQERKRVLVGVDGEGEEVHDDEGAYGNQERGADGNPTEGYGNTVLNDADLRVYGNRARTILLEYTKVQNNHVLDIVVVKEPFRDCYVIFGKDIEDGQRYELRLKSEDVSSILDGDILVTSVDNIEVWMALLHKVELEPVNQFSKLMPLPKQQQQPQHMQHHPEVPSLRLQEMMLAENEPTALSSKSNSKHYQQHQQLYYQQTHTERQPDKKQPQQPDKRIPSAPESSFRPSKQAPQRGVFDFQSHSSKHNNHSNNSSNSNHAVKPVYNRVGRIIRDKNAVDDQFVKPILNEIDKNILKVEDAAKERLKLLSKEKAKRQLPQHQQQVPQKSQQKTQVKSNVNSNNKKKTPENPENQEEEPDEFISINLQNIKPVHDAILMSEPPGENNQNENSHNNGTDEVSFKPVITQSAAAVAVVQPEKEKKPVSQSKPAQSKTVSHLLRFFLLCYCLFPNLFPFLESITS